MSDYLGYSFKDNESFISTFDEAPLWSAAFGLLLLKHLNLKPKMTVLDVGSGTGFPLLELAGRLGKESQLFGIDPWENAQKRAKQKLQNYGYNNVTLLETTAEKIPLDDNSVDLIVSNLGVNNFEHPSIVFDECHRILKPKGKLALTTNVNGHWKLFYDLFAKTLIQLDKAHFVDKLILQQERRGDTMSISTQFSNAGFTVSKVAKDNIEMSFTSGSAFLDHHFIKLGWLKSWMEIFPKEEHTQVFGLLERNLNNYALENEGLNLTVPMIFIEGKKSDSPTQ